MKWIKHATDCSQDPKIQMILDEFGPQGYAAYWLIVERIASEFDGISKLESLTLSGKIWQKISFFSKKNLKTFLNFSKKIQLLDFREDGNLITIIIPNLLKYSDEFTRKAIRKHREKDDKNPESIRTQSGFAPISSSSTSPSQGVAHTQGSSNNPEACEFENPKVAKISGGPF